MDLWVIFTLIGSVGLLATIIGKYTGTLDIGLTFIGKIFDAFKSIIMWAIGEAPKPIRVALFLIVIIALGGVIINNTFGAQYICFDDSVKKTTWIEGLTFRWLPSESALKSANEVNLEQKKQEYENAVSESTAVNDIKIFKSPNLDSQNFVRQFPSEAGYKGVEALMTPGMAQSFMNFIVNNPGQTINPLEQFYEPLCGLWSCDLSTYNPSDFEYQARIDICLYDGSEEELENTCVARLYNPYTDGSSAVDACDYPIAAFSSSDFGTRVGSLRYFYEDDSAIYEGIHVDLEKYESLDIDVFSRWGIELSNMDDCAITDGAESVQSVTTRATLEYIYKDEAASVPVYQLAYGPLFVMPDGQPYADVNDLQFQLAQESRIQIIQTLEDEDEALAGIMTFTCDQGTENPYDVRMHLFGIDILDPKVLALLVAIGVVIGIYSRWGLIG